MEESNSRRAFKKALEKEIMFRRAEMFHKELMEDFRFMEAARMHSGEYEAANLNTSHLRPQARFKELMVTNPHGLINFAAYSHQLTVDKDTRRVVEADIRSLRFGTRMAKYPPLDIFAHWLLNTTFFSILMVLVITVNSILIAVDLEIDQNDEDKFTSRILEDCDFFFLSLFVAEIILKWIDDFRKFWTEGWNLFDFLVTATSLIAPILDLTVPEDSDEESLEKLFALVKYLRIIRIFRSLNVVTRIQKIRLIWEAVVKTFHELFFITLLIFIFFYIFAIIGIRSFEPYTNSHLPNLGYRNAFSTLQDSFVTLFQLFTLDHYQDLIDEMSLVMDKPLVCFYIILWIFLGSFIFRNIFTGVMVNNFQSIRQDLIEEDASVEDHKKLAFELNVFDEEDKDGDELNKAEETHLGWEDEVFHNMKIIQALGNQLSPTVWPRDTLFQYYILLEALASNLEEKNTILRLLDHAVIRNFDP